MIRSQAVADQVHDAGLQRRGREHQAQRLGDHPELGPFCILDPQRQYVAGALMARE